MSPLAAATLLEERPKIFFLSCVSDLQCKVRGTGTLPAGERLLTSPPLEVFTSHASSQITLAGTALRLTLTVGLPAAHSGISQMFFSPPA